MKEKTPIEEIVKPITRTVSFQMLGALAVAFLLGCAAYALIQNLSTQTPLTFSTPSIIAFVLSVLLAGASIVLAIAAIMLGKFSEQAMIKRSDESIRLQNEVFQKTTDALQRIESSTGVTEKRIEDIISGRVGDLSQRIVEITTEKQGERARVNPKEIENTIRRTLLQGLREENRMTSRTQHEEERKRMEEEEKKKMQEDEKRMKEYQDRHMRVLQAFSNLNGLKAMKMSHGTTSMTGDDLFDSIFVRPDGERLSATTFQNTHKPASLREFATNSLLELKKGSMEHIYTILFESNEEQEASFRDSVSVAAPELIARMTMLICPPEKIEEIIGNIDISNKAIDKDKK